MFECFVAVALFRGNVIGLDIAVVNVVAHGVIAYINMLGLAIFGRIVRDLERRLTVSKERDRTNWREFVVLERIVSTF